MYEFTIKISNIPVAAKSRFAYAMDFCKEYIVHDQTPELVASVADEELQAELERATEAVHKEHAECVAIYRKIADQLPFYDRMVVHGAAITYKDAGILFVAPSGTGKSTHIKLWKKHLKQDVDIVNGDKPILHIQDDAVTVYGTPWAGKEGWQKNRCAPLKAICIVRQSKTNRIEKIAAQSQLASLLKQIYLPQGAAAIQKTLALFDALTNTVPIYILECDISKEAVEVAFNAIVATNC